MSKRDPNAPIESDLATQLETLVDAPADENQSPETTEALDFGRFKLIRELGRGGMGRVFLARQLEPVERHVAFKIMRNRVADQNARARFEVEVQILAQMQHPAIAQVHDAGTTPQGYPYFAMEYVDGEPLNQFLDKKRLTLDERLDLFLRICQGVQHAHQRGIIHRDLKPANILVTLIDGVPSPKIIDFGIATAARRGDDDPERTRDVVGTPEYMAPEQFADGDGLIDPRSDVYSLGVILYEMLVDYPPIERERLRTDSGRPTWKEASSGQTLTSPSNRLSEAGDQREAVAQRRDTRYQKLLRSLRGDLDAITLKALDPVRENRYDSPAALHDDIVRHREQRPVLARPATPGYRVDRFVQRNAIAIGSASAILLALIAGLTAATLGMLEAQAERDHAQREALRSEQMSTFVTNMLGSIDPNYARGADTELVRRVLDDAAIRAPHELAGQPGVLGEIEYLIGRTYLGIGEHEQAHEHLVVAERLIEVDDSPSEFLSIQMDLARIEERTANLGVAIERSQSAMDAVRGRIPPDDLAWLDAIASHGAFLAKTSKLDEAVVMLNAVIEQTAGATDAARIEERLSAMSNLVWVLSDLGDFEQSEHIYEQGLAEAENWDDPSAQSVLIRLVIHQALSLQNQERHIEALELLRRALALEEAYYGSDSHPMLVTTLVKLASTLRTLERLDEARPVYERAMVMSIEGFGADAPMTIVLQNNFGNLLRDLGDPQAAVETQRRALAATESAFPPGHVVHGIFRLELGQSEMALGNLERAVELIREAHELLLSARGKDYHHTEKARRSLEAAEAALANEERG